jgi:phasin
MSASPKKSAKAETATNFGLDAVPEQVKAFAETSVDQAQAAVEKVSELAHESAQLFDAAANAFKTNATDFQLKAFETAQTNLAASFAFVRKLIAAKDPAEAFNLNQSYLREQFAAVQQQATELNEIGQRLARETTKPVQDSAVKSFAEFRKTIGT